MGDAVDRNEKAMPPRWRYIWEGADGFGPGDLLTIAHMVTAAVDAGDLTRSEAGALLRPMMMHPSATAWRDGEFVEMGIFADQIASERDLPAEEADYVWAEIRACVTRLDSAQQAT